jgi:NAD(P)-dependent dehydrogenase (short-subunit alcohol dehydrogenase family)
MSETQVWFITGTSTGFGRSMTEAALAAGHNVVATLRKPEVLKELQERYPSTLLVLQLDVTKPDQIEEAFAKAKEAFGRIDVVFNNAGAACVGEIEGTPMDKARAMFESLFWGAANVSTTAVRYFREENKPQGGRLLQVSSKAGVQGCAGVGYYSATKFALEGFSEALQLELDPKWNIKITLIEPGPFKTGAINNLEFLPIHPAYEHDLNLPANGFRSFFTRALLGDPDKVAPVFLKVAQLEDPPLHFPIHEYAVAFTRKKAKELADAADKYESWSQGIYL